MSNLASDSVMTALAEFIKLRRDGLNREEAWKNILTSTTLTEEEQTDLLNLAKKWEQREGNKHLEKGRPTDPGATMTQSVHNLPPLPKPAVPEGHTHPLTNLEDTSTFQPNGEMLPKLQGRIMQVLIHFKGFPTPIQLMLTDLQEVIVGRSTTASPMSPDVDLTPLNGAEHGVSRIHASLERRDDKLFISDLGSRNFTLLNNERLYPHEIRALKNGDQIWFGRMLAQINYRLT